MLQKTKKANLAPSLVTEAMSSIEAVFNKTINVIEENHAQICNIYETICEEVGHKAIELKETKAELSQVIDSVDKQEIETQRKKRELASVTKEYVGFDEQIAYEKVEQFIKELKKLRDREAHLKNKRDVLERQLRNLVDSQEQAQRLTASISSINSFLTKQSDMISKESHENADIALASKWIVEANETEKLRLAHELHDSVEERLNDISFRLNVCEQKADEVQAEAVKQEIQSLKPQISKCLNSIQQSIFDMLPPTMENQGFVEAVTKLLFKLRNNNAMDVKFRLDGIKYTLPQHIETTAYRIVQESLTNIKEHSGQSKASVYINYAKDGVHVIVQDDGAGFDVAAVLEAENNAVEDNGVLRQYFGVISIKARAKYIGAKLSITSQIGHGAKVHLFIPKS